MLVDVYSGSFAFVQFHVFDEYDTPWGDDRWNFYGPVPTPTAFFDGADPVYGSDPDHYEQYESYRTENLLPRRAVSTDVTIDISAEQIDGPTYSVSALVGVEEGGTAKTMRIYVVQVLDHWPPTPTYHRNTFMQAAPTHDITLSPDESHLVESEFTFDEDSWDNQEDIKIVVWAQALEDPGPPEVYQAATRSWPLVSGPNDADGDGVLDAGDNCPHRNNPDQDDTDGDDIGDTCDNCLAVDNPDQDDADEDSFGDACDNCPLLHHLNQEDTDGDDVGDVCDSCPEVSAPAGVDASGRSLGDIDPDCDVDLTDFGMFGACFGGPGVTDPPLGCDPDDFVQLDLDTDGDVDLADYSILGLNFTGPL
jgi:hypothetical protein